MQYLVQPLAPRSANGPLFAGNEARIFAISSANSGLAITATAQGVVLTQSNWAENANQQWRLNANGDGTFRVTSVGSGMVLDVNGGSTDNGALIIPWPWHGGPNQRWRFTEIDHGHFRIDSVKSGRTMDVEGGSQSVGARIIQWDHHGGPNQQWILSEIRPASVIFDGRVTLYEHGNFQGRSQQLGIGSYDLAQISVGNDVVSSVKVPNGMRVTLFEHGGFRGRKKSFTADASWVGDDFNDITSGVMVEKVATVYEHGNYQGASATIGVGRYNATWAKVPGSALEVSVGPNGRAWVVNNAHNIYEYTGDGWVQRPGAAMDIGVGANGAVWVIGTNGEGGGYGIYRWNGSNWDKIAGSAVRIAVKPDGNAWVVNNAHNIYEYTGSGWVQRPGAAVDIGVGADGSVWVIGTNSEGGGYGIYRWNGSNWDKIAGSAVRIAVKPDGNAWVVNNANNIYEYTGGGWIQRPGAAKDIGVGPDGTTWVIGTNTEGGGYGIYRWTSLGLANDVISSLKVPQGLMVTLYEHSDFTGASKTFFEDSAWVGDDFNDKASAVVVKAIGVPIPNDALRFGGTIQLRGAHGKWVVAESGGQLNANRGAAGPWETFTVWRAGTSTASSHVSFGDIVALRSVHGKYVVAEADGNANANRDAIGPWEQWQIVRSGATASNSFVAHNDVVSFRSVAHNKYLVAEADGNANANRTAVGPWEQFTITGYSPPNAATATDANTGACGAEACGANVCAAEACGADACGAAVCGAAASLIGVCGAAASGIAICGADVSGAAACLAAACGAAAAGIAACGADACGAAACGAAACGAAVCGAAACGGDACGAAASGTGVCLGNACGADAGGVDACPADVCGANVCGINACPADACAADACALDIIPIIPGI